MAENKKTKLPLISGILLLVVSAFCLGLGVWGVLVAVFGSSFGDPSDGMFIVALLPGVIALAGGICAITKRFWWASIAASVIMILMMAPAPLGVASLVMLASSKNEFR